MAIKYDIQASTLFHIRTHYYTIFGFALRMIYMAYISKLYYALHLLKTIK